MIVVSFTTTRLLTAIAFAAVPDTVTAVAPVRFVPVRVTETAWPRLAELGAIDASVGAAAVAPANSTAPTSTALFDFRRLPKKSSSGAAA